MFKATAPSSPFLPSRCKALSFFPFSGLQTQIYITSRVDLHAYIHDVDSTYTQQQSSRGIIKALILGFVAVSTSVS